MKNITGFMKQAQQLQEKMVRAQEDLEKFETEGVSGAGMVKVIVTGKGNLKRITIDPNLINKDEVDVLEDLIIAAFNDGKAKADAHNAQEMEKLTGGLSLPAGMKFPF